MTARMIKKSWWIDLRFNHTRYRKRSPENTRAGALAYESTLRQRLARGEDLGVQKDVAAQNCTFEDFSQRWFNEYVIPNNKHQEQRMKKYILRKYLVPSFGKTRIAQIGTHDIERFKAGELRAGLAKKTVNNHLAILSKCIKTAYEWHRLPGMPPKIALLKCPPPSTEHLSPDECELLFASAEGVIREMILTGLRTGMRQGEIRALQWSSINWENRTITVRHSLNDRLKQLESPKSNRARLIPMDVDVYETLHKRKMQSGYVFLTEDGTPFDSQRFIRALTNACKRAGLPKITPHKLRHTFGTQIAEKASLQAAQALLGHSSISTTMRYVHVAPETLRNAFDTLSPKSAISAIFGQPVGNQSQMALQVENTQENAASEKINLQAKE